MYLINHHYHIYHSRKSIFCLLSERRSNDNRLDGVICPLVPVLYKTNYYVQTKPNLYPVRAATAESRLVLPALSLNLQSLSGELTTSG